MNYNFDRMIERRTTDSPKWGRYGDDLIPLWVADMDFQSEDPILQALHRRVDHGIFGYTLPTQQLREVIQKRLRSLYHWSIEEEEIVFLPGLVTGLNVAAQAYAAPGEGILVQPPVYFHFLTDPVHHGRVLHESPLVRKGDSYEIDLESLQKTIREQTKVFLFCNPHNPAGRVYTRRELESMAEICLRHRLVICSDEIHCDLLYPGYHHIPIATLALEVADRTVTLMSPSKTYNLAGLDFGFAVIKNPELRKRWRDASLGIVPGANIMGHVAALAALGDGQEWLDQVLVYLLNNRDYLNRYVTDHLPGVRMLKLEATYLAWLDCQGAGIPGNPSSFFLREAKVAVNDGIEFGTGGEGFVRLNFACPRKRLTDALDRMAAALKTLSSHSSNVSSDA